MSDELLVENLGAVRVLTLNRPEARNALSDVLISALYRALLAVDTDDSVRAVVVTGADPAFCAGLDLKQAVRDGAEYFRRFEQEDCVSRVALVAKPVIGAVNGPAITGGLEIALGCDFLLASDRALFADTHVRVGVLPGGGLTARLPRLVGSGWARRMSMTGEVVDADLALRIGLVTEVVAHDRLRERALDLAAVIAKVPAEPMQALKQIYTDAASSQLAAALEIETTISREHTTLDGLEERRIAIIRRNRHQLDRA